MKNKLILAISLILIAIPQGLAQEMRDPFIPIYPPDQTGIPASITQTQTTTNIQEPIFNQKIIKLASIDAKEAMQQLQQVGSSLLSPKGTVNYHQLTNSLLVKDIESRLPLIEEWVKQLDTPKQQVQITAHIISSSRMALQELGLEWGMLSGSPNNSRYQHYNRYSSRSGEFNFNLLNIGEGILELKLNALEKENLLSIIASPRLIASHENPASIQQGTEIPYVTSSEKKTQVQFKDAVLGMEVTPTITRDEHVKLLLKISHNSPDTALTTSENHHLAINKQEIATSVTIKNNETLILGGIFQQKQEKTKSGLPFLSNIPLLGELFTNTGEHIDRRVLVIFITPKLVNI